MRTPIALALFVALLLPSCVSTKDVPLSASDRSALRGKTVTSTKRGMPSFGVMTPGAAVTAGLTGAIGGAIVGSIAEANGRAQVLKHQLPIPEETITKEVMKDLVSRCGAKALPSPAGTVTSEKPEAIAAQYRPADYVLDVRTIGWGGCYYPLTFTKTFISYTAKMRLIETKTGRVIAEGYQLYHGTDKEHAPNYDGIYANGAAFLRQETKKGTDAATAKFRAQLS